MQLIAASKFGKAQQNLLKIKNYEKYLNEIGNKILTDINDEIIKKYRFRDAKDNLLLIVFSADKGFCGSFNSSVIKKTVEVFNKNTENYKNIDILPVGKKALAYFKKNNFKIINDFSDIFAKLQVEKMHEFAEWLRLGFLENRYDKVLIVFNSFKNAASQEVTVKQFLPMVIEEQEAKVFPEEYIFEPSRSEILESFIPFVLKTELTHLLFESNASEQGARMTNMMKSTDNADALIKSLRILYNQSRQAMITNEIIEISAGANAIK
jgi:F-type H+-transporting ATPase subunit gamma